MKNKLSPEEQFQLIKLIKVGNESAFRTLYDAYFSQLFRLSIRFLKSPELAEETVHDVFLKLWINRSKINDNLPISPYLFKICKNQLLNQIGKITKDSQYLKSIVMHQEMVCKVTPELVLIEEENKEMVIQAIRKLPAKRQLVYKMCREEGRSYKEVAYELGISEGTVNSHIIKAHQALKKIFKTGLVFILILLNF